MENEIFKAGVRPGAPATNDEIKLLICYILSKINAPMSFEQMHETLLEHEFVNYFELISAMDSLENTGHIQAEPSGEGAARYTVTELGRSTSGTIDTLLPVSVRDRAVSAAEKLFRREKRKQEVKVSIEQAEPGYEVRLSIPDNGSSLVSFTVFCPTEEEAGLMRRRFLNDPFYIYKGVLALLTGDKDILGEIFPAKEDLF